MDETPRILIDRDTTWRAQVWSAFCARHVGLMRDPTLALRGLVEEAVLCGRWAEAFTLAAMLDREEDAIIAEQQRERAARQRKSNAWRRQYIAEDEQRVQSARKRKRQRKVAQGQAELREVKEAIERDRPPPKSADQQRTVAHPASTEKEDGGREASAHTPCAPMEMLLKRLRGEDEEHEP